MSKKNTEPSTRVTTKQTTCYLAYKFTDGELLTLGKELGEKQLELRKLDDDRKAIADEWKAKLSAAENQINNLSNKTSSGYEYRNIPCTITFDDPGVGAKTIRRNDNDEVVKVAEMEESEKQREFDIVAGAEFDRGVPKQDPENP